MTPTDRLFQLLNQSHQLCNSFLQPCYRILAVLKGGLLETRKTLEVHHLVFQEKNLLRVTIDAFVRRLPLLREDNVVLLNGVLNDIGRRQHLLPVLFSIHLDLMDLGPMGSLLHLSVIHLQEEELVGYQEVYSLFSYPRFKLHYPG